MGWGGFCDIADKTTRWVVPEGWGGRASNRCLVNLSGEADPYDWQHVPPQDAWDLEVMSPFVYETWGGSFGTRGWKTYVNGFEDDPITGQVSVNTLDPGEGASRLVGPVMVNLPPSWTPEDEDPVREFYVRDAAAWPQDTEYGYTEAFRVALKADWNDEFGMPQSSWVEGQGPASANAAPRDSE